MSDLGLCLVRICYFGAAGIIFEGRAWLLWVGKSEETLPKSSCGLWQCMMNDRRADQAITKQFCLWHILS